MMCAGLDWLSHFVVLGIGFGFDGHGTLWRPVYGESVLAHPTSYAFPRCGVRGPLTRQC